MPYRYHRDWHGIMHVGDPPTSIVAAKACSGAKEQLDLRAIGNPWRPCTLTTLKGAVGRDRD
jgi:hypothetical protein